MIMSWKIYFWLFSLITTILQMTVLMGKPTVFYIPDIIVWLIDLIGLWCFAYHRTIYKRIFWSFFVFVKITWDIAYPFILTKLFSEKTYHSEYMLLGYLLVFSLLIPQYIGLFFYGYGRNDLWETTV